ncbi:hypothetical protein [Plantactinospora sp. DSM 117369]
MSDLVGAVEEFWSGQQVRAVIQLRLGREKDGGGRGRDVPLVDDSRARKVGACDNVACPQLRGPAPGVVGLSLPEVVAAMALTKTAAQAVVRAKIAALESEVGRTQQAIVFLQHTVECRHRYLDDCPECATFVREP